MENKLAIIEQRIQRSLHDRGVAELQWYDAEWLVQRIKELEGQLKANGTNNTTWQAR